MIAWADRSKTPPPAWSVRCTSAVCRTGCPRRRCAPPATGWWPGSGPGALVGDLALEVALGQGGAGGVAVVGGIQGHRDVGGQRSQRAQGGQGASRVGASRGGA